MHVLITADTVGGVWTYTRELVSGLSRSGVRVTLVSFGEMPSPEQSAWTIGIPELDFRPTGFRLEWMEGAEREVEESQAYLETVAREVRPDVLHLNQFAYARVAADIPRVVVAHSDVVSWSVSVNGKEPEESAWLRWYRGLVDDSLRRAEVVVTPSRWMMDEICRHYVRPARGVVIYNGRNPEEFATQNEKEPLVLAVGRLWDEGKQVSLLAGGQHPVPVWIVGAEDHPEPQHRGGNGFRESGLKVLGRQSAAQLRLLYGKAATYAATSCYEPFGLAPLEAALSRCALVANDIPVFHELWGDSAYYFRKNDAKSLASAIRELSGNAELHGAYAAKAYAHAIQELSAERMCREYEVLYHNLISEKEHA
ncbi:MAG TPA: glycosyltransferase family 4 protein [Terriglobales bacterium]|nr:glycosyltransferase family 4 protein [Terriglobales bacterium]